MKIINFEFRAVTLLIGTSFYIYLLFFSNIGIHFKKDLLEPNRIAIVNKEYEVIYKDISNEKHKESYENLYSNGKIGLKSEDFCGDEPMVYTHTSKNGRSTEILKGKNFDCSNIEYLKNFKLTHEFKVIEKAKPKFSENFVFVIAADTSFYASARAVISTIPKNFGQKSTIILYDLGGINNDQKLMTEIKGVCNLDFRVFDFNRLPNNVRDKKIFAWKVFIIAEIFMEYEAFFYLDSSIFFENGDFGIFFDMMYNASLAPVQMSGWTGHSIRHATHKNMYEYIPMDPVIPKRYWMMEANMMFFYRNEDSRQLIKWSILCAVTRDCIEPPGSNIGCSREQKNTPLSLCHRQDQSVFNILLANLEFKLNNMGQKVINHMDKMHPKNTKQRHSTRRGQMTNEKIDFCKRS